MVLLLAGCGTEVADVYVVNPCDRSVRVRLSYSPIIPGGDTDQVYADVGEEAVEKVGRFGKENLSDALLEVFPPGSSESPLAYRDYRPEPPRLQEIADQEVYVLSIPADAC